MQRSLGIRTMARAALALATVAALAGMLGAAAGPAAAASGPAFTLKTTGTGVKVAIAGTTLVGAVSSATAGSSNPPVAQASGTLTPASVSTQQATATTAGTSQQLPRSCAQPPVPFPAPLSSVVNLGAGCSAASASQSATGLPSATATGQLASIAVSPTTAALPVPVTPGSALASGLQGILGTLPALPAGGTPLNTVLQAVAKAANTSLTSLLNGSLGTSTSTVTVTAGTATAKTQSTGSKLSLLTGLGAGGGPLLTITGGPVSAVTTLNRTTGQVTSTDTPAALSVTVNPPVGGAQTVSIAPGQSQTFLSGTPLQTTVAAGAGTATPGSGQGSASATGFTVDALQGIGSTGGTTSGGVQVVLGAASASVSGAVPVVPVATPVTPAPPPAPVAAAPAATVPGATTVHTGEFWSGPLPLALLALLALGALAVISRRRLGYLVHRMSSFARHTATAAGGRPPGRTTGTSSVSPLVSGPARRHTHRAAGRADRDHGA